jgi:hypothetical protein
VSLAVMCLLFDTRKEVVCLLQVSLIVGLVKTCSTEDQHCLFSFPKKYFMRVDTLLGLITSIFTLNILKLPDFKWDVRRIFLSVLVH